MHHIPMHPVRRSPSRRIRACALSPPLLGFVLALAAILTPVGAGAIGAPLKAAGVLAAEDSGFIEITVRMCPPGFDPAASGADPDEACESAPDGIQFTLQDDNPATDDRHAETGQRGDSIAVFDHVTPGQYLLVQHVPDGVDEVIILSCEGFNTGPFYRMPLDEGSTLDISVPDNAPVHCVWLNVLAPGATPVATPDASPQATPARDG